MCALAFAILIVETAERDAAALVTLAVALFHGLNFSLTINSTKHQNRPNEQF